MEGWASYHHQWLAEGLADCSARLLLQSTEKKPDQSMNSGKPGRKAKRVLLNANHDLLAAENFVSATRLYRDKRAACLRLLRSCFFWGP